LEIGRVRQSDLEAISQLHIHFWGEPSDIGAMSETLTLLDQTLAHLGRVLNTPDQRAAGLDGAGRRRAGAGNGRRAGRGEESDGIQDEDL